MSKRTLDFADGFTSSTEPNASALNATDVANTPSGNVVSTTVQGAINEIQTEVDSNTAHQSSTTNPHNVTKTQVGLSNVDNTSDATKNAAVATLTNKTLTNPVINVQYLTEQSATPATPAAGTKLVYAKTDNKLYQLDSAGIETELGAGGGGGYNANPEPYFQTDEWVAEGVTTGITWTVSATDETLGGAANPGTATLAKDAANRNGQGRKVVIPVAKEASTRGFYSLNKTFTSSTGLTSGDFKLVAKDQLGVALTIEGLANGGDIPGVSAAGFNNLRGIVRLNSDTTELHLAVVANDGSAVAKSIKFHGPFLGEGRLLNGPQITGWESVTQPTTVSSGTFDANTITAFKRRVNDELEVRGTITFTGTPSAFTELSLTIPGSLNIDTTKIGSTVTGAQMLGNVAFLDNGVRHYGIAKITYASSTSLYLTGGMSDTHAGTVPLKAAGVTNVFPFAFAVNDTITFHYKVPIAEWAAEPRDVLTTAELMNVTAQVMAASAGASVTIGTALAKIAWDTEIRDTTGSFVAGTFTAPRSAQYLVEGFFLTDSRTWITNENIGVKAYINGTPDAWIGRVSWGDSETKRAEVPFSGSVYLTKGQTLEIWAQSTVAVNLIADSAWNRLTITELPDFSVYGNTGPRNKVQTKILSANVTATGTISDWTFNNLTVGNWYEVSGTIMANKTATGATNCFVTAVHNSADINTFRHTADTISISQSGVSFKFKATATTLLFTATASASHHVFGDGTRVRSYIQLEERNDLRETTEW